MRKSVFMPLACATLCAGAALFALWPNRQAAAQSSAAQSSSVYIAAIDLVIIPSELPKFLEAIKENAAAAIKEPGVRAFNVAAVANTPNHILLYEVYENEEALKAHRETEHFKKYMATTSAMIAERSARPMSLISFNVKAQ